MLFVRTVWWLMMQAGAQRVRGSNPVQAYVMKSRMCSHIFMYNIAYQHSHSCWVAEVLMLLTLV